MKWSQIKKVLSMVLCVLMVVSILPTSSLAEDIATATPTAAPASEPESASAAESAGVTEVASDPASTDETDAATDTSAAIDTPTPAVDATPTPELAATDAGEATPTPEILPTPTATPKTYVVNFVVAGETIADLQQTVEDGGKVKAPSDPAVPEDEAYAGQIFLHWSLDSMTYDFSTPVSSNLVLVAVFGTTDETPVVEEEPLVTGGDALFAAFSMEGGILPDTTPLWTYTFVVDGEVVDTKIMANGDTLDAPAAPEVAEGQEFTGWYTDSGTRFDSFGVQTVTESGATTLTAHFTTVYYVFFYNQFGSVIETRTPDASNNVSTADISELQLASDEALMGWSSVSGGTSSVGSSVTVSGANVNLYPIIQKVIWISFDSAGGAYISPMYITPGTALTQTLVNNYVAGQNGGSSTIIKAGYTFTGWSGYTLGNTPTANVALTAGWTAATVGYTVLFWQQAVEGDSYAIVAGETVTTRTALSGSTVTPSNTDTGKTYKGFDYNGTKSVSVTVNGDGSTVLNVYYDREIWTVNFYLRTKTSSNAYSDSNSYTVWKPISGRYGSKLNYWPGATETNAYYSGGTNNYGFTNWLINSSTRGTYLTYLEIYDDGGSNMFNSGVLNLYGIYALNANADYSINHYRQNLDGTWPTSPNLVAYAYSSGSFLINNRFEGFTAYQYKKDNGSWTNATPGSTSVSNINSTLNIRHTRNSYTLTIRNFTTALSSTSVLYESPIVTYQPSQPSRPSGIPTDYVWAGWYTTQEGYTGSEMVWSQTMPAHDLIVYGVWKAPTFTGIAHSIAFGSSGGSTVDLGTIAYGGTISSSALAAAQAAAEADRPLPTDTFGGWLIYKNGSLILFNSSMRIYENVVLYPVWISTANCSITYNLGEATGTVPVDSVTYVSGAQAQVKAYTASAVTAPADKVFVGWRSSVDSKIYYPNSAMTITQNTTLTAVWVYSSVYVTITYNGNGGATSGGATTFTGGAANNTYHSVQGNSFLYTGKNFVGWNTATNGGGSWYYPGDSVLLGVSISTAPGTLYAIWEDQTFSVSVTANPAAGVSAKSGAGNYVYNTNATVTWTLTNGYQITSVTDNGTTVPASSYSSNSYAISGILADHAIVINTQMTLFSLIYNGNGGTVGGNASYSSTKTIGTSFNVDANTFTRAGYYFLGWSTSAGATTADSAYAPGTSVVMPGANLTLYAVWGAKTAVTLTANSASRNYDGTEKSVTGISASVAGLTVENTTASAAGTNPGVYATSFVNQAGLVLKSGGVDVTERYTVSWANGNLTVNPQVTYRVSANNAYIGTEWVAYGTGDATYSVTPPANVNVGGTNYYWIGTYSPAIANDLTTNTTIYASYTQNKTLVITADSASYPYNGTVRYVTTGTVDVSGVTVTGYTVSGSGMNVDTYTTSVTLGSVKIMSGTADVTNQYDVSTVNGLLTITPADMTVTSSGYTGTYDGDPHGISVTPDVDGSTVKYSLTNSTNPADYTSTNPTVTDATTGTTIYFMVTNPNYNPVFDSETIVINKRVVSLTTEGTEKVYDTLPLTDANWSYDSDSEGFVEGQGFATSATNGTITNVGTANNGFSYTLTEATNAANYTFDVTEGVLKVTKANTLSVDATDYSDKYDGDAHGVTASANVPGGTTIYYRTSYSGNPADYTLTSSPTATHVDDSTKVYFVAVNDNYEPAFGDALITILPREITLTGASQSETYSGTALTNPLVTIGGDKFLDGEGYETMPTANGTITNVGSVNNTVSGGTLNASTDKDDYTFTAVSGSLAITAATLTVQANDQQITYPANRPATGALTYTLVGGNVDGETPAFGGALGYDTELAADPLATGTYTDAIVGGTLALSNSGTFKADNYSLTVLPGDLTVDNGAFTVTLTGGDWTYDGDPHGPTLTGTTTGDTITYYIPDGSGGWTSTGTTPPTVTDVGDGPLDVKVVVTREGYDPAESTTTLTILPADMTVKSSGYTGTYDNQPHGITVTPDVDGSTVKYSLTNSTNPADYTSTNPTVTDATAGTTVYFMVTNPNYNPVFDSEVITINKRIVALTTEGAEKVYDTLPLTDANWSYDSDSEGFVEGQGFATSATNGTITNVGTKANGFTYTLTEATNAANYTFDVTEGVLKVTKANTLAVDATDYSDKYDGDAHGVTASANVSGGTTIYYRTSYSGNPADYTLTTSPTATHVDDSTKVYFVAVNDNYEPAFGDALITILPREITLTGASQSETYSGTALTNSLVTIGGDLFLDGEGYQTMPTANGTITNVGSVNNTVSGGTLNSSTTASDYTFTPISGSLAITAATLTVQANDQQIAFPANRPATGALTYTLVGGNVDGETPAFGGVLGYDPTLASDPLATGTYTDAIVGGTLALANSGTFKAANYSLTVLPGDLTVDNGAFTVTLTGGDWTYDGDPHGPTLTGTTTGDTITYYIPDGSGGWTSTGSTPPTVTDVSDGPLDVKVVVTREGYDPAESTTTLTILPADMTVTSSGYTGTYDNQSHGITVTPDVDGSTVKYSLTNSTNPADYTSTNPTVTDATVGTTVYFMVTNPNYNPVFDSETIVINKRVVSLTTEGAEKVYDTLPLTDPNWSYDSDSEGFVEGQGFATSATNGTITNVGTANNGFVYTLTEATNAANYTFDVTEGVLKVTKANTLSVDATDYSDKYDGDAHGVTASANVLGGTTIYYRTSYSGNPADYTLTTSPTATHVDDSTKVYFVAVNDNYEPAFGDALITILPREITLTGASQSETYSGTALTNPLVTVGGDKFLDGEGYETMPTANGTITNVGSVNNTVAGGTLNSSTTASDYTFTPISGTLAITAATLTVQANDQQIAFPANRPATGALTYTLVGGNVDGETPAFGGTLGYDPTLASDPLATGTYTDAIVGGTLALSNFGTFKADNYSLTVLPGDLKVANGAFTVTLTGGDWTYDGDPHGPTLTGTTTGDTITYYIPDGSGGWTSVGTTPPTVTDVSDGPLDVKVVVTREGYDPAESTTTLTILPADMTVTSSGYTGTYDNQPHGISVSPDIDGSTVKYSLTNSTNPADYTSTNPTVTDATVGTTVYFMVTNPNYNPVFDSEVISINKRVVSLTTEGAEKVYDTLPLTNPNWSYDGDNEGFVGAQGFNTAATTGTITNVGTTANGFSYTLNGVTNAANYTFDVTEGVLKVTKANTLSVDATDYSDKYDGDAHGVTASANVLGGTTIYYRTSYSGNPADYTLTSSPTATHVDDSTKVYFVAVNDNYEPAFGDALITILPREITLTGASQSETYSGTALTNPLVTIGGDKFLDGEGYETMPTANGRIIDVGSVNNTVVGGTLNASTDKNDYTFTPVSGSLAITAATLTVQANDQQIAFPANRLATGALTYTLVGGNVDGETPAFGGVLGYDPTLASDPLATGTYTDAIVVGTLALSNSGAFKADNYSLVVLPGDLTVANGAFTVTLTGGDWTYDGDPHGPTLTGTTTGDTITYYIPDGSGGWTSTGSTPPTVTDVSDGPLDVKVVVTREGYDPAESTTTLTILPADMTVTSTGYTGTYDNQPHGISVSPDIDGSTVKYSLTNSTNPADYTSTNPTVTDATVGTTVYFMVTNPNYNPVFDSEVISINKRVVSLTTEGAEKVYDTLPLTNPNWSYDGDNEGFVGAQGFNTAATTGTITNVGTTANGFSYTLNGVTNAANYTFDVTEGVLKVTKANTLSVDATDYSDKYDGDAHGVTASANVLGGTTIYYRTSYSGNPADYTLTSSPTATHVDDSTKVYFVAVNDNYEPAFGDALITILPREITLTGASQSETYSGTALTNPLVTIGGDKFLDGEGYETMPTANGRIIDVGSVNNTVVGGTLNASTDKNDYTFTPVSGSLAITAATLTVQANDQQIAFPANRLATGALTYTLVGGNVDGETPAFGGVLGYDPTLASDPLATGTYTDAIVVGTLALSNSGAFKADNYSLVVLPGDLTVANGAFTVTLTGGDWTYDGDPHGPTLTGTTTGDTITYYIPDGSGGWTSTGSTPPTVTDVSDGPLDVKVVVTREGYDPAESTTTLTILPADMTVTSTGYTGTYDGNPHGITVTPDVDGSTVKYSLTNSTNPADYTSTNPTVTDATTGITIYFMVTNSNYNPVFDSETIVINKRVVSLTTEGTEKVYDTLPLTDANWSYDSDSEGFVEGQGFATSATNGTITNVGTANNGFDYTLTTATNSANYTVDVTEGILKVTKADTLTVDATDYSDKYDGDAHGVTASANVPGGTTIYYRTSYSGNPADYTLSSSPTATHVDDSTKVYFVAVNDNYEPAFGDALITILPRELTLTGASQSETYSGTALTNPLVTIGGDKFLDGEGYQTMPTANGTITNVGSVNNTVSGGTLNASTDKDDYTFTAVSGSLAITAATLTVQANDQQIAFPANRPATGTLTYTLVGGNVDGETPAFGGALGYDTELAADPLATGTYTDAIVGGTLALANSGTFKATNYSLTVLPGDLKVVNGAFTVTLTGGDWTYDGDPHGPTLTGTTTGDTITYYIPDGSGGWTSTGSTPPTVIDVSDGPLDVKVVVTREGYDPAESTTTLTILPADMTVTSSGYTGTYDGNPHGITVTPDVDGSTVKYSLTNSTNPADYTSTNPTVTDATTGTTVYFMVTNPNYNPVFDSETIVINKRVVSLTTEGAEKVYDTLPLTDANWSYDTDSEGFVEGQGFATSATNGTITNVGTANNGFDYTLTTATNASNYTFDVTEGVLKVTKANTLAVDATDYSDKYDGGAHGVTASANVPGGTTIYYRASYSGNPADYTLSASPTATHVDDSTKVYFVAVNDNYEPAFGDALITILPREITLTGASQSETYSGVELTNPLVTIGGDKFLDGEGYETMPTANGTITNVGSVNNTVSGGTLNASTDKNDYTFTPISGTLAITAATLTVQANDQQIAFPANRPATGALTYTLVGGNVDGETPAFGGVLGYDPTLASDPLATGTYTDAIVGGTLALANSGTFKATNYSLTVLPGDLKVANGAFTVTLTGGDWTYDGDPHGPTLTGTTTGDTITYYIPDGSGGWTSTGSTPPTVTDVSDGPLDVKVVVTREGYDPAESTTTLTILPADMTVTSTGYTGTYDGNPHGITVTPDVDGSTVKYSLTNSTNPADYTSTNPTVTDATTGTTVYFMVTNPNYNPVFDSETIVINKRVVSLTTEGAEKVYDTLPLTDANWSYDTDSEGFVEGQGFATSATNGTITNVGTANNGFDYTLTEATNSANYTFDVTEGVLKVTKANTLSVDATDYSDKYDGGAHGVTASANVPGGTTIYYRDSYSADPAAYTQSSSSTATHVDDSTKVYFVAVNDNYEPAFGDALITILPREITLTGASQSETYSGVALTNPLVTIGGDKFLDGEGYETMPTANGTITNVGSVNNTVSGGTLNASTDKNDYTITPIAGSLAITPATLTVQANVQQIAFPANRPATGALTYTLVGGNVDGETPAFGGVLGYDPTLASDPLATGTYTDAIVGGTLALANSGTFKAANYSLTVLPGDLTVDNGAFTVTLTGGDWTYDGDPHGPTLTGTTTGDTITYYIPDGSGGWTSTGSTPPTVTDVSDGPLDVKVVVTREGYDPAESTTTLTILPADMTVTSSGYTGTYDNQSHGITVTPDVDGSTVKYSLTNSTNPADYTSTNPTVTDATVGTTVYFMVTNPNYNPVFDSETIVINKRVVSLTTEGAEKVYDTLPLTDPNWSYDSDSEGFVEGQGFATSATNGTITNVGTANNGFVYTLTEATNAANYTFDVTEGVLKVTKANTLSVDATDYSDKYDGDAHGVTASANVLGGTTIYYRTSYSGNPADYTLTTSPTATHVDDSTKVYFVAVNDNYEPAFGDALITILPREITLTGASQSETYSGTALTNPLVTVGGDKFLDGEGYETMPTANGTITNVGSVNNTVAGGTLNSSTTASDYTFTPISGTLAITAATLTVQANDQQIAFPANRPATGALTYTLVGGNVDGETPAFGGTLGYDPTLASDPLATGTYTDAIVGGTLALSNFGTFKADNYSLTVLPGDLKVANGAFTVTLTGGDWTYDGDPHGPTLTGTTTGDTITYYIPDGSGGWTSVGTTPPTVTDVSDGPLDVKVVVTREGYDPAESTTTLTILPADMTVTSSGYTGTYDNQPHGISVSPDIDGSTVKYSLTNSTNPADYTSTNPTVTDATVGTTVYFMVTNPNYNPVFDSEVISINKRVVSLTTEGAEKVYDTLPLTNPNWSYDTDSEGFVEGQGFATSATNGTITNVGTANNGFTYTLTEATNAANYTFDVTEGVLKITKANTLSVDATDYSDKYDGGAHGVTASANIPGGTTIYYRTSYSGNPADYTLTSSPTATHVDDSTKVYFVAVNDNYEPAFGDALITILPREITLTGASQSETYSGVELTNPLVTIGGDKFLDGEGYETMPTANGRIIDVGSVNNTVVGGTLNASTDKNDYTFTPVSGSLAITAATLTVQANDQQIAFPANRLATGALTYTLVGGNVDGETPAFGGVLGYDPTLASDPLATGTYTDAIVVGTLALSNSGAFKADNYSLVVLPGDLTVANGAFTVTLTGGDWTYDGDPHGPTLTGTTTGDTITYYIPDGSGGWTSTGSTPPTVTDVSDGPLDVKVVVTREGYDPAESTTTLTILPADMTVTSTGYTGTYDGNPHGITVTPDVDGSTVKYSLTNSTNPADYTSTNPTVTDATTGTTVYFMVTNPNYNPVFDSETIVINKRIVALTTEGAEKVYDTLPLTNPNWSYDGDNEGFVGAQGFNTAATTGTITNVGTTANGFSYTLNGVTNAANYTFDVTEGVLKVTKADTLSVDATDYSDKYDGKGHGVVAAANVTTGTVIRYSLTPSTDPADYLLASSPLVKNVSDTKTVYFVATNDNYEPAFGSAEIAVTPRTVAIDTADASRVYNGLPLKATGWSIDAASDGFVGTEGFATAATTGTITNVSTAENGFTYTLKSTTLSENYELSVNPGTLEITPRAVMIAAVDASKNYGAADPAFAYTVKTGTIGGTTYYSILPADLSGVTITVDRMGYDSDVGVYAGVLEPSVNATPLVENNYLFSTTTANFTINPRVAYNLNTTDKVTGFPQASWFTLGTDATVATASGVQRVGYHLIGWEDAVTGEQIALGGTIPAISDNHTLNALWEIAYNDVLYVKGTTDPVRDMPDDLPMQQYGTKITVSSITPYHSGYGFLYWKTTSIDGTEQIFNPGDTFRMPDNHVVLVAVWEARTSPVYYHDGLASGKTVEQRFATDSTVTVAGNMFTNPGYRFLGWSLSAGGSVVYQPGSTFTMPPRQVNLYAIWEAQTFTVTYIVTGGTGTLDGTSPYATFSGLKTGDTTPVPSNPTLEGYTFDGWTTVIPASIASGNIVIYGTMTETARELEEIPNTDTPLAGGAAWALLNLILAIATALASILMLVGYLGRKKEEQDGVVVRETKKYGFMRILTLVPGIGGIIAFILTENMKNPMVFTDRWTMLMILIAAIQLILVVFGAKKDKDLNAE